MVLAIPEVDDLTKEAFVKQSRESYEKIRSQVPALAARAKDLLTVADGPYVCPGYISFLGIGAVHVEGWMLFPPETGWGKVKFDGVLYGPAAIHGGGAGIGIMTVRRDELLGEVSAEANVGGVGPGLFNLNVWRGTKFFGAFSGGGVFEGAGIVGGTLTFERL